MDKDLTDDHCVRLKDYLVEHLVNEQLSRGILGAAAVQFSVSRQTVSRLWREWRLAHALALNGEWDVTSGKKKVSGRGIKYNHDDVTLAGRDPRTMTS